MGKKALVVGGSNGIGLAVARELLIMGYSVIIVDKEPVDIEFFPKKDVEFYQSDLLDFDLALFEKLAADMQIGILVVTAGIGRVARLEFLHSSEIHNTLSVNTLATINILRIFYCRIRQEADFYTAVVTSVAGRISSPIFSVYAASKAAVTRFIESVNVELECSGVTNRILDVAPGYIEGTRFSGGVNDLTLSGKLAGQIVKKLLLQTTNKRSTLFIPDYEETYRKVLESYRNDPHEFGIRSYQYKLNSGRVVNKKKAVIGYCSGTFDLFHIGHLNLLKRAKRECDYLIVGVHPSGAWKGKETFIPLEERKEILAACRYVNQVVEACEEDSDAWHIWHFSKLFVGSDYQGSERFLRYETFFKDKGVTIIYFPYTKSTNSTQVRAAVTEAIEKRKGNAISD